MKKALFGVVFAEVSDHHDKEGMVCSHHDYQEAAGRGETEGKL